MISFDAWFLKFDETLWMKIMKELPFIKYKPALNLKDPAEVDQDAKRLSSKDKRGDV